MERVMWWNCLCSQSHLPEAIYKVTNSSGSNCQLLSDHVSITAATFY